jgi:hypothetical protein
MFYNFPKEDTISIKIAGKFKKNSSLIVGLPKIKRHKHTILDRHFLDDGIDKDEDFKKDRDK